MPVTPDINANILEEDPQATTSGHYAAESVAFDAAANVITNHDLIIPIGVSLLTARVDTGKALSGDKVGFDIGPETLVGTLPGTVAIGATVIGVPQSVIDLFAAGTLFKGQILTLDDGTNKDHLGIVTAYDAGALTVTVKTPTTYAYAIGDDIKITTSMAPCVLDDGWVELMAGDKVYIFGESKIGGSFIPAGKVIRVRYNNTGPLVRVLVILEYLY